MSVNIRNVLDILEQRYEQMQPSAPTEEEIAIANNIIEILEGYRSNMVEIDEYLDYDEGIFILFSFIGVLFEQKIETIPFISAVEDIPDIEIDDPDDDEWSIDTVTDATNSKEPTFEEKTRAVEFADTIGKSGKKPKLSSVGTKFRFVKTHEQLNRWRRQILSG